jgi:hypothetical protein
MAAGEISDNDFETVKRYLLECPHVPSDHPAIKAALEGIEKEQTRRERDAKLQAKFAAATTTVVMTSSETTASSSATTTTTTTTTNLSDSMVVVDTNTTSPPDAEEDDEMMEWQDVGASTKSKDDDGASSFLGTTLAKIAIDSISEHQVKVQSPVAAIALIFHATLRSDLLGFSCTGIPEDETKSGFAAPVRVLPKTQFLPPKWDSTTTTTGEKKVALRYRKNGTGAMVLMVTEEAENRKIQVQLQPASTAKEPSQSLSFSLEEHVNLDSWNAALKVSSAVPPALHYKFLAVLLTNFLRTFDLGAIIDEEATDPTTATAAAPYVDNTAPIMQQQQQLTVQAQTSIFKSDLVPPQPSPAIMATERRKPWNDGAAVPSTLDQAFPGSTRPMHDYGDFADDLRPAGIRDPGLLPGGGRMGGNLMGPNHPMFSGGGPGPPQGPFMGGGPGSMQPRFDPFLPPIVDPDFGVGTGIPGRNRPSRSGEPNPDHLPPPNAFGGHDMFS